ncbi:related to Engulfment and cell motility gene 1 protein [Melanopsichium pennsylvanicum]|uniref:Related to Engulfment and cell motility gene 1 protein n=2 Tax=Melanopsichium pennsylvanicum TaxID=63383 RepID=A0AAJ4XRF4_9BASI|nr:related to Engulfment and cell motility gene 1 protein [Melanopsichium pennsylvanicum 4]SNX87145.1 related to Engulfment and cell motility gene 1 protein [Melanopsichium pennsylvanicum]
MPTAEAGPGGDGLSSLASKTNQSSYIDSAPPQLALPQIANRINLVTYGQSTIKALIDPSLPVQDVIRQLCANTHLGVQEPPALFALRDDDNDELVDDANMAKKIEAGANFKLCSSPTIEAVEMVDKLSSRDDKILKMATYTLQRLIREPPFTEEFIARGGVKELLSVIHNHSSGNTLAYALTSCQNLMEGFEYGWEIIDAALVAKVVNLLVSQERINVCRPATAILKKLVVSGPQDSPKIGRVVTDGRGAATTSAPPVYRYGFEFVYDEIQREKLFLQTLVNRIGSSDTTLKLYSLSLINSLLRNVSDDLFENFTSELEKLNASKAVAWLMDSNRGDELSSSILDYQSNVIRAAHRRMRTTVTPTDKRHVHALSYIWLQAKITDIVVLNSSGSSADDSRPSLGATTRYKWRRIGFASESAAKEFGRTGWLGLSCLESFVRSDPELYSKIILEQISRAEERRCMFARASIEVTSILADHWDIESGSFTTTTTYLPFLLSFPKVHHLALRFFLRMWNESGAAASDFPRVSALVRSQVNEALGNQEETSRTWSDLEDAFLHSEYRTVRDRQMKELEMDEDHNAKISIRNLRGRIYRESYDFVRQQRIQCMLEGAWFRNLSTPSATALSNASKQRKRSTSTVETALPHINASNGFSSSSPAKPWRFYRLAPDKKLLYYCDTTERLPIRGGLDDLPERIDLSLVTDVAHSGGTGDASGKLAAAGKVRASGQLVISLLQTPDACLAEMEALNLSQFSEWTDGLNMLRADGGVVSTRETADLINMLTEIGIKVKLLDLTGEQIELPTAVQPPPLPSTTEFFFAEL